MFGLFGFPGAEVVEEVLEEEDKYVPPSISNEELARLMLEFDIYLPRLSPGQYEQALMIWEYDPSSAIRYCDSMISPQFTKAYVKQKFR